MLYRPKSLSILAISLVIVALSFPLQIMFLYEHSIYEVSSIFSKISFLNYAVISMCLVSAVLLLRASPYAIISAPILLALVTFNNWWVGHIATDYTMANTLVASLGFFALHGLMLTPKSREVLLNPDKRWWRVAKRNQVKVPISVSPWIEESFNTETFDLSNSGAFLNALNANGATPIPTGIKPNDFVEIRLKVGSYYQIRCTAQVVRVCDGQGNYPGGVGIQFTEISPGDQKVLDKFIEQEISTKQNN